MSSDAKLRSPSSLEEREATRTWPRFRDGSRSQAAPTVGAAILSSFFGGKDPDLQDSPLSGLSERCSLLTPFLLVSPQAESWLVLNVSLAP